MILYEPLNKNVYVDDVFVVWDEGNFEMFFERLNHLDNNIKFMMENGVNNSFPFLDVLNIKSDSLLKRRVFSKLVKIDNVIPITASTQWGYKMPAFNSFIRRAHTDKRFLRISGK